MNNEELLPEWLDVTPEQLRRCLREEPLEALKYRDDELLEEQRKYWVEKSKNDR